MQPSVQAVGLSINTGPKMCSLG